MVLFFCVFMFTPKIASKTHGLVEFANAPMAEENQIDSAGFDAEPGIYLTRPKNPSAENIYFGSVSAELLAYGRENFNPVYTALVMQNDNWSEEAVSGTGFEIKEYDPTKRSISWSLREDAPAAVYGIRCSYQEIDEDGIPQVIEKEFKILYAGDWTYIQVTNDQGERRIKDFAGGDIPLYLNVFFNDGAAEPDLYEKADEDKKLKTGVAYGSLEKDNIVDTKSMVKNIVVKTVSGKVYSSEHIKKRYYVNNRVELYFTEPLENDIYMVQFTSNANNSILGQFIIDNSIANSGVNLSQLWVVLMSFGGFLALGGASAYLIPLFIVKINEARVYKENERVARLKNPEAYAKKKKKSFKEIIDKIIYNIKTPAYKRKKDAQPAAVPEEEKEYSNRFTEMLRERKEKRDFMREHNVSSEEMERMKAREAEIAMDEENSFAGLRDDDDDEIATFHAAQEEISTLETGAYVDNGARFAKLDSLRENEEEFNYGGNNGDDGGNHY